MSKIHSSSRLSLALACVLAACADGTDTTMDTNNAGGNNGGGWNGGGGDTGGGNNGGGWNDGGGTGGGGTGGGGTGGGGSGGPFCGGNAPETTSYNYQDNVPASQNPPGGIPVNEAPLFISFGWDDNSRPDSMNWAVDMAAARKNPDGSPIQMTFFYTTTYLGTGAVADPKALKAAWKRAMDSGHEVGLHSITHATSKNTSREQWTTEITGCIDALTKPYDANEEGWDILQKSGIGAPREIIYGWRTPFLGTNDDFLPVLKEQGIWYDASMEEGFQYDQDGTNFVWPYTLDNGSPGDELIHSWGPNEYKSPITKHPGLWELPVYVFVVPPELRGGPLSERQPWFQPEDFKITGFDYNLMVSFKMNKDEYLATLKYTLDQRLRGNRAPMLIGVHTDYYDATYNAAPNMTYEERRAAIEEFVDYALSFPEVRFKSYKQVFDWMRNPSPLTGCN